MLSERCTSFVRSAIAAAVVLVVVVAAAVVGEKGEGGFARMGYFFLPCKTKCMTETYPPNCKKLGRFLSGSETRFSR